MRPEFISQHYSTVSRFGSATLQISRKPRKKTKMAVSTRTGLLLLVAFALILSTISETQGAEFEHKRVKRDPCDNGNDAKSFKCHDSKTNVTYCCPFSDYSSCCPQKNSSGCCK